MTVLLLIAIMILQPIPFLANSLCDKGAFSEVAYYSFGSLVKKGFTSFSFSIEKISEILLPPEVKQVL